MAFQPVLDTAQIEHIFTLHGVAVQNVHYAEIPGGYALANLQALADAIDAAFATTFTLDMPSEVSYIRTDVRGLAVENDLVATQNAGAGTGTHAGVALPSNVTFALKKSSGLTGRSARGRTFWIGVPDNVATGSGENFVTSAWADAAEADIDFLRAAINGVAGWNAVLVSRFQNKVKRAAGKTFPWLSTSYIDQRLDTQRSRLPTV